MMPDNLDVNDVFLLHGADWFHERISQ